MAKPPPPISFIGKHLADLVPDGIQDTDSRLVNAVFEGEPIQQQLNLRDPMGHKMKIVSAPPVLNFRNDMVGLTAFLTKFRRSVLRKDRRVYLDLSSCRSIDIVACMLLTAEIQRCDGLVPNFIHGCDPLGAQALDILRQFGFHEQLGIRSMGPHPNSGWTATIRSGAGANQIAEKMAEVADLAFRAWGDQAYTDQIHAALNEAMTNVIMHAYPESHCAGEPCLPGMWWAAGVVNTQMNEAWFFALDQGVGLPRTAIRTYEGLLERWGIDPANAIDHLVIAAAIKEARTQTGLEQHGKGLNAMIRLIDEKSIGGSVLIASRGGEHMIVKNPDKDDPRLRRVEFGRQLLSELPGTLIAWKVNGPIG